MKTIKELHFNNSRNLIALRLNSNYRADLNISPKLLIKVTIAITKTVMCSAPIMIQVLYKYVILFKYHGKGFCSCDL